MQLTQRGKKGIWWFRFTAPNGKRIFRSARTKNKRLAQEYADKIKHDMWRTLTLKEKPKRSWQETAVRYIKEKQHRRTIDNIIRYLRGLDPWLHDLMLEDINRDVIDAIIESKLGEGLANASVNRFTETLRAVLNRAKDEWEWIDSVPKVRMLEEDKGPVRWLTHDEAERLYKESPAHTEQMVRFSLATGLREANVTGLKWSQIDMDRKVAWFHPEEMKPNEALGIPLNEEAMAVLRHQAGKHKTHVFCYCGKSVKKAGTAAFKKALVRAGIKSFRWHDLRHTWASWHIQKGTPLHVLQELGGWTDADMVKRYAHLGADHLAGYASNISSNTDQATEANNLVNHNETKVVAINYAHKKAAND